MVITAQCLGLRVSEIVALRWSDFDFERLTLLVERSAVKARVDEVKTEYSRDEVPLHPDLARILLEWRERALWRRNRPFKLLFLNQQPANSKQDVRRKNVPLEHRNVERVLKPEMNTIWETLHKAADNCRSP
jgi:integrase